MRSCLASCSMIWLCSLFFLAAYESVFFFFFFSKCTMQQKKCHNLLMDAGESSIPQSSTFKRFFVGFPSLNILDIIRSFYIAAPQKHCFDSRVKDQDI